MLERAMLAILFLLSGSVVCAQEVQFETYRVRWWGTEGSMRGRPEYQMARADNGVLSLHYGILPGRPLADYTLPYSPIRSFLSIVHGTTELAHQVKLSYGFEEETELDFVPRSGVEVAKGKDAFFFAIRNRSVASPEDRTFRHERSRKTPSPWMQEYVFQLRPGDETMEIDSISTNVGEKPMTLRDATVRYVQSFNWSVFGISEDGESYERISAPSKREGRAFFAYSKGMECGYAFVAGENCRLRCEIEKDGNRWTVAVGLPSPVSVAPKEEASFRYAVRVLAAVPENVGEVPWRHTSSHKGVERVRIQQESYKMPPVDLSRRVTMDDMFHTLSRPKMRGMNVRGSYPGLIGDMDLLRRWEGNQIILYLGDPEQTEELIEKGHSIGLEVFLAGRGGYREGPPHFDAYYDVPRPNYAQADSHGQDEDHAYWECIPSALDFEAEFGKPMAMASQKDRVAYWGRCFAKKWRGVFDAVRPHAPQGGIWFYAPMPGVTHVDPLDYYDTFFQEIAALGPHLTVFPFYYGAEYRHIEYMVRRWKDADVARVVFLPMRDFLRQPSQYVRAISAARKGASDGACGFHFGVTSAVDEDQWQWRSVLLAAQANFPTLELKAYSLMEEPAQLVEALACMSVDVVEEERGEFSERLSSLKSRLPHEVRAVSRDDPAKSQDRLMVEVVPWDACREPCLKWIDHHCKGEGKGALQMRQGKVLVMGCNAEGLSHAWDLLLRFSELAQAEWKNGKDSVVRQD